MGESDGRDGGHEALPGEGAKDLAIVQSPGTSPPGDDDRETEKTAKVLTRLRRRQSLSAEQKGAEEDMAELHARAKPQESPAKRRQRQSSQPQVAIQLDGEGSEGTLALASSSSPQSVKRKRGSSEGAAPVHRPVTRMSKRVKSKDPATAAAGKPSPLSNAQEVSPSGETEQTAAKGVRRSPKQPHAEAASCPAQASWIELKLEDKTTSPAQPAKQAAASDPAAPVKRLTSGAEPANAAATGRRQAAPAVLAPATKATTVAAVATASNTALREELSTEIREGMIKPEDVVETIDSFPYYLGECVRTHLVNLFNIHLKNPAWARHTTNLLPLSNRVLLTGPPGSEICREKLVKALAKFCGASVIVFDGDSGANLGDPEVASGLGRSSRVSLAAEGDKLQQARSARDGGIVIIKDSHYSRPPKRSFRRSSSKRCGPACPRGSVSDVVAGVKKLGTSDVPGAAAAGDSGLCAVQSADSRLPDTTATNPFLPPLPAVRKGGSLAVFRIPGGSGTVSVPKVGAGSSEAAGAVRATLKSAKMVAVRDADGGVKTEASRVEDDGFFWDCAYMEALMDVLLTESKERPCVLLIKEAEKNLMLHTERCSILLKRVEEASSSGKHQRFIVVASQTSFQDRRDRGMANDMIFPKLGSIGKSGLLDPLTFLDCFGRLDDRAKEAPRSPKPFSKLFGNRITLHAPVAKEALEEWKRRIQKDTALMRAERNRKVLRQALRDAGLKSENLDELSVRDQMLNSESAEKLISWGVSHQVVALAEHGKAEQENHGDAATAFVVSNKALEYGVQMLSKASAELQVARPALKDFVTDNDYERRLLSEVIPPNEVGVTFDDIGALDKVKDTLQELVMLPLQRPELFTKGQLTRPCKGILLFGPPGSGKTMLAKAVATEAGANFINISMSSIASKWFGEGEKVVKAVFSLASRIAPSVIFIDEVDSMLGRRERPGEHEAMRKIKNEFMANWDGLRTRDNERVIVLAATNRPFDLDDAVIRRLPRRLLVDLPDAVMRSKILKVILAKEELEEGWDYDELAAATDGYSGSDLKNLCVAAAYRPVRELLAQEKLAKSKGEEAPPAVIRPLRMDDMRDARKQVSASVAMDATSMGEIKQWNEQFGEGGSRRRDTLTYFT